MRTHAVVTCGPFFGGDERSSVVWRDQVGHKIDHYGCRGRRTRLGMLVCFLVPVLVVKIPPQLRGMLYLSLSLSLGQQGASSPPYAQCWSLSRLYRCREAEIFVAPKQDAADRNSLHATHPSVDVLPPQHLPFVQLRGHGLRQVPRLCTKANTCRRACAFLFFLSSLAVL